MRLNWGPFLYMRCYNNGAQFLDQVVGAKPNWQRLERAARACAPGAGGTAVLPFAKYEPSLGIDERHAKLRWFRHAPGSPGKQFRASLEAIAYLIRLGVEEHEHAGQKIQQISVSGGIARSDLMCEILATVLGRRLERLESDEGPALGAAVTALAALEANLRRKRRIQAPFTVADAVRILVRFREPVDRNPEWSAAYEKGLATFRKRLAELQARCRS
jgi:sugar (pentulose or hexulose) kinase